MSADWVAPSRADGNRLMADARRKIRVALGERRRGYRTAGDGISVRSFGGMTMTGLGRIGAMVAILSASVALALSSAGTARGIINFETLRSQGMALRDEIRGIPCWKNQAELDALGAREDIWQEHVTNLGKSDPDIRKSGGGWKANRLSIIWNEIVDALSDLRHRPCPSGGTPLRGPHNLPISNDDDWGDPGHASVAHGSTDPYPRRGMPQDTPYGWPGGSQNPGPSGDHPGPGGVDPFPGGGPGPAPSGGYPVP